MPLQPAQPRSPCTRCVSGEWASWTRSGVRSRAGVATRRRDGHGQHPVRDGQISVLDRVTLVRLGAAHDTFA